MKINLEYPFNEDYKAGYLLQNKEPRNLVCLVRFNNTKTSVSYARYLMSCKLKRYLLEEEHVDHKDDNKLNDVIDNLQIITQLENNQKCVINNNKTAKMVTLLCPSCKKEFDKYFRQSHLTKKGKFSTCSKQCLYDVLKMKLSIEQLKNIGETQIIKLFRK